MFLERAKGNLPSRETQRNHSLLALLCGRFPPKNNNANCAGVAFFFAPLLLRRTGCRFTVLCQQLFAVCAALKCLPRTVAANFCSWLLMAGGGGRARPAKTAPREREEDEAGRTARNRAMPHPFARFARGRDPWRSSAYFGLIYQFVRMTLRQ